jgi:hypothetical protein
MRTDGLLLSMLASREIERDVPFRVTVGLTTKYNRDEHIRKGFASFVQRSKGFASDHGH